VNKQVQPLKLKAEELLGSIDSAVVAVRAIFSESARKDLSSTIEHLRITFENLSNTTYQIDTLVTEESDRLANILEHIESIAHNLDENEENINNVIRNLSDISDSLAAAEIPSTFALLNKTVSDLNIITGRIAKREGSLGALIYNDTLYRELEKTSRDLNLLLEDIRKNPKKYVRISVF